MAKFSFKRRVQEKLADLLPWVQYPNIKGPTPKAFEYEMPFYMRFFLVVFGSLGILVAVICACSLCLLAWAAVAA